MKPGLENPEKKFEEGKCPFCFEKNIAIVTNCYDGQGRKICELWACQDCGGFFPRMLDSVLEPHRRGKRGPDAIDEDEESEKRRTPRFPVQFVVQVDFYDEKKRGFFERKVERLSEPIVAMVLDAGAGGLCFRYPEFIEEGKNLRMKISLPSAQRSFSANGRVVRSTRLQDGSYGLGIEFTEVEESYRRALERYVLVK